MFIYEVCEKIQNNINKQQQGNTDWQELESCIFSICAVFPHDKKFKHIPQNMTNNLKNILEMAIQLDMNDHVRKTVISLTSRMSEFPQHFPGLTPKILGYVIDGIVNSQNKKVSLIFFLIFSLCQ